MVLWLESILSLILHEFKSIELQFIDKFTAFSHSIPSHKTLAFCDKKHCILSKLWHKLRISHIYNNLDNKHFILIDISSEKLKTKPIYKLSKSIVIYYKL